MTLLEIFKNVIQEHPVKGSESKFKFEFCRHAFLNGYSAEECHTFLHAKKITKFHLKSLKAQFKKTQEFYEKRAKKIDVASPKLKLDELESMMRTEYDYYYDVIKDDNYIRLKTNNGDPPPAFERLNDRHLCTIWRNFNSRLEKSYLPLSMIELDFKSGFFPKSSGLHRFFEQLPKYDGKDYIGLISSCVKTNNDEIFSDRFKRWFVAMVGTGYFPEITNDLVLILSGEQGVGKTRFFKKLLPGVLSEYFVSKLPKMRDKDTEILMSEHLLITVDEIDALNFTENTAFKELITSQKVSVRKPYDKKQEEYKRYASFSGTTNRDKILTDTTGSRRFLCFRVESIDLNTEFPIAQAFAQATYLINNGFKFWLDLEDIAIQEKLNEEFRFIEPEEELLLTFTKVPDEKDRENEIDYLPTTILLQKLLRLSDSSRTLSNIAVKRLGAALTKHDYKRVSKRGRKVWEVIIVEAELESINDNKESSLLDLQ